MGGGLAIEVWSDKQKSDFKVQFPEKYCNVGLYRASPFSFHSCVKLKKKSCVFGVKYEIKRQ
jgi:hypothetical protein